MPLGPPFEIHERREDGRAHLLVTGELDLVTAPELEERLNQLRGEHQAVVLDLSQLEFMDSTGLHVLVRAFNDASSDGWHLEVDRELSPQVRRLFQLANVGRMILADSAG